MIPSSPTESSPAVSPERAAALARLLRLLESARPADIAVVASLLPEAELAAVIEISQGRLSWPLREYLLTEAPSSVLVPLVRQLVLNRGEEGTNSVERILMRFDPAADAAFFADEPEDGPTTYAAIAARRAILRERKGPDGRPVIPPGVKRMLLDVVAADDGRPELDLLRLLAIADDPDLVLAVMPHAGRLSARDAANAITTLVAHGMKKEARRHRGLWAGRGGDFTFLGFPRFAKLPGKYALADRTDFPSESRLKGASPEEYRKIIDDCQSPSRDLALIPEKAWFALRAGTIAATEVVQHTRPAGLTMLLAVSEDDEAPPGERRAAADIRALIKFHATDRLADDPKRWAQAIIWANRHPGTLADLLADPGSARDHGILDDVGAHLHALDAANILLAMAPYGVAKRALLTKNMKRTITYMTDRAPLCRALVEHVLAHGTVPQRENLAANEHTPDSVLLRLLERTEQTSIAFAVMQRDEVGEDVLDVACAKTPRGRALQKWIADRAYDDPTSALRVLRANTDDPAWILSVLRSTIDEFDEAGRVAAYTMLADVAGLEAVWALELDVAGNLDAMEPYVRATMVTGDTAPLIEAAREALPTSADDEVPTLPSRTDADLDQPLSQPLEDLIRAHLDGRADRWLELADRLQARPEASDEELIAEFGVSADGSDRL